MDAKRIDRATQHFRRLLRLYPLHYRETFGAEMTQVFRDMYRARLRHGEGVMELWIQTYIDIGVNAMVQSVSSRSKSNEDAVVKTVRYFGAVANWLVPFAVWAGVIAAFDSLIVTSFYRLVPPDALGVASESELTVREFAYLMNAVLGLCLLPIIVASRKRWSNTVSIVVSGGATLAAVPLFLRMNLTYPEPIVYGGIFLQGVGTLVVLALLIKGYMLLRQKKLQWMDAYKIARNYVIPALIVGGALLLERVTAYVQPLETLDVSFVRVFMHNQALIILGLSIVAFGLIVLGTVKKYVAYCLFCLILVLSALNVFGVRTAHHEFCAQLTDNLYMGYASSAKAQKGRDDGLVVNTKTAIQKNCDPSYDRPAPDVKM